MCVRDIPATAVGNAKGSSIIPSRNRFPGNSYLTSTQARTNPITALISDAKKAVDILTKYPDIIRGRLIVYKNSEKESFDANTTREHMGKITITDRIVIVIPNDNPNPGIILFFFIAIALR